MMKIKSALSFLLAVSLTLPLLSYADESKPSATKTFVKDSVITSKIKTDLAEEKLSSLLHIKVDTDEAGAVMLSGKVATQELADKAEAIAKAVKGVTSVENNIKVVPKK